jgi:hypothetical protein
MRPVAYFSFVIILAALIAFIFIGPLVILAIIAAHP